MKYNDNTVTIGADPEIFLIKEGEFHSANGIIPGTKEDPYPVKYGAVQVDGMALEFNVQPATSAKDFYWTIEEVLSQLREMIPSSYDFSMESFAEFKKDHIETQPPEALRIGCSPDWDAYLCSPNEALDIPKTIRTAAGHIHIGWTEEHDIYSFEYLDECCRIVKQLDYALGIPSILEDRDHRRRSFYGKPGAFRPKRYGLEYRVLSNYWIHREVNVREIFNRVNLAFTYLNEDYDFCNHSDIEARDVILSNDRDAARDWCIMMGIRIHD